MEAGVFPVSPAWQPSMDITNINRLYTEVHLNWSVTEVSISRLKGNIIPFHFRKAFTVLKLFFNTSCVSTSQKVQLQCPSSCVCVKTFYALIPARRTGWKRRFGARWNSNVCSLSECLAPWAGLVLTALHMTGFWACLELLDTSFSCHYRHYLNSFAATSKCDVLTVDGRGRRCRQGEKILWELSQHIRNSSPAAQTKLTGSQFTLDVWTKLAVH